MNMDAAGRASPLVSVIVTNYNYGRYLVAAINSILDQTYPHVETIVSDDGSTDESRQILERYGDRVVSVLRPHHGQASAQNAGFAASTGDIICFLQSDDMFVCEKVETIVDVFRRDTTVGAVFHSARLVDEWGEPLPSGAATHVHGRRDFRAQARRGKMPVIAASTSCLAFRRTILDEIFPVPEDVRLPVSSDHYIKWTSVAMSPIFFLDDQLVLRRIHGKNGYAFRKDHTSRALHRLVTATWMTSRHPELGLWSHRVFADGLASYRHSGAVNAEIDQLIRRYLEGVSAMTRVKILAEAYMFRNGMHLRLRSALSLIGMGREG